MEGFFWGCFFLGGDDLFLLMICLRDFFFSEGDEFTPAKVNMFFKKVPFRKERIVFYYCSGEVSFWGCNHLDNYGNPRRHFLEGFFFGDEGRAT